MFTVKYKYLIPGWNSKAVVNGSLFSIENGSLLFSDVDSLAEKLPFVRA